MHASAEYPDARLLHVMVTVSLFASASACAELLFPSSTARAGDSDDKTEHGALSGEGKTQQGQPNRHTTKKEGLRHAERQAHVG